MLNVLKDFGFSSLALSRQDFLEEDNIIQLGFPPNRIDILTSVDGIEFANSTPQSSVIEVDGVNIHLIGIHNLIENKIACGRLQDLADVEKLQAILREQGTSSD